MPAVYLAANLETGEWERTKPLDVPDFEPISESLMWGETVTTETFGFPAWRKSLLLNLASTAIFTVTLYGTLDGDTWSEIEAVTASALGVGEYALRKEWADLRAEVFYLTLTTVSETPITVAGALGAIR